MPELHKKPVLRPAWNFLIIAICIIAVVVIGAIVSGVIWYNTQLSPVSSDSSKLTKININKNSNSSQISKQLADESIIRNSTVFDIYVRLSGKSNNLKAGVYRLSPAESIPQIVEHLVNGSVDQFSITFYPGATLIDKSNATKKYDINTVLKNAGFSNQEINEGLTQKYDNPLFANKPIGSDLEGYIYGETYNFNVGATVQDILNRTFDEFYKIIEDNDFIKSFSDHNLNLFQGITLASIIQREASNPVDQKQVAQVFYSRLASGTTLGSDVTYQYIADKTGVTRDPGIESPYNTRLYAGLPPGPISVPGLSALQAVANPASGDYFYFLSGDDDKMYYAHTESEHNMNIVNHCKIKCSTP